jgi:hypothetical protein
VSFADYLSAQQSNLDEFQQLPHFTRLLVPMEELYKQAVGLVPRQARAVFGRLFLLSHKDFMSAAALVLRGLPDDAEAVTRRAVEAARIALAIKYDPENLRRWIAKEQRQARWKSRQENKRPDDLRLGLRYPPGDRVSEELGRLAGMLSDAAVHFTPEFLDRQSWSQADAGDDVALTLSYFIDDQPAVEAGMWHLAANHILCLQAFDSCYDGAFLSNSSWKALAETVRGAGREMTPPPETESEDR